MADKTEVRIVLFKGGRLDLKTEIGMYEPATGKVHRWGCTAGPRQEDVDREVWKLKNLLESQGNYVTVVTR